MNCNPAFVLRLDIAPLVGDTEIYKAAIRPYPTSPAYEGKIRGGVVVIGDCVQAMCDRNGSPVVNRLDFTFFDPENYWRDKLADPNWQYLTSQDITLLFGSTEGIAAEDTALVSLFRGQLLDPAPQPRKLFSFSAEGRLGTRKGPYDLDQPVNKVTGQRAVDDGFTGVPRDSVEKRLRVLVGEKTDKGTKNKLDELVEQGRCVGVNLGPLPGNEPVFLPKPVVTWQKYQTGSPVSAGTALGSRTYTYILAWRTVDGQWSLSDPVTITGMPAPSGFATDGSGHRGFGTGVQFVMTLPTDPDHLAAITNPDTGLVMGNVWVKDGAAGSPSPYHHMDGTDANEYDDNGDDSHYKSFGPKLPSEPLAQLNAAAGDFWCFLRHKGKGDFFVSDLGGGSEVEANDDGLPPGAEASYTRVTDALASMVDAGDDDTGKLVTVNSHDYFGIVLSGALAIAAREGMPPRANLCGYHQDNDLTNPIINQAALGVQLIVTQMTGGPEGRGHETGPLLPIASFASFPSVPIVQTSRIQDTQDKTKAFLGTDLGYLCCIEIDDATTWRQFLEQVWIDWHFDHFENEHGQFALSVMDDLESPDDGTLLREGVELDPVTGVVEAGAVESNEIQNFERYAFDWDAENGCRSGAKEIKVDVSIARYGLRGPGEGSVTEKRYTNDAATAFDAAGRMLADRAIGPAYPTVVGKLRKMIPIPLGTQFRVQHRDLIQTTPVAVYLRERVISSERSTITLRGRDRRGTYAPVLGPEDAPDWADASELERATYLYVTDEDGMIDGVPGPRLR